MEGVTLSFFAQQLCLFVIYLYSPMLIVPDLNAQEIFKGKEPNIAPS